MGTKCPYGLFLIFTHPITCFIDIDECMDGPCVNGNCTDHINNYTCTCTPGYTGRNCSISKWSD